MQTFTEFFNAKKEDNVEVIILSNKAKASYSAPAFEEECKKRGLKFHVIEISKATLVKNTELEQDESDESGNTFILRTKEENYKINSKHNVILARRGVIRDSRTKGILASLEKNGFFCINNLESILNCENKWTSYQCFVDGGVSTPRSALVTKDILEELDNVIESVGGKFPLIVKTTTGSHGVGVSVIESRRSFESVMQTYFKLKPDAEFIVQEMIDADADLRIHVLMKNQEYAHHSKKFKSDNFEIIGQMKRNKIENDFRTNVSLGGTAEAVEITKEQQILAMKAAKAVGCVWCGVDIMEDKKTGKSYVLEVNASAGTQGIKKYAGKDVVEVIVDFIMNKEKWQKTTSKIGLREVIKVKGVGSIVAKFDTGNGATASSITYDTMNVDGKYVDWTIGSKSMRSKILGYADVEVGQLIEKRPIVLLDIEFDDKKYKDVPVFLSDRKSKSTKFLVNRELMDRMCVVVDANSQFLATEYKGNYNSAEAKDKKYMGIAFERE